MRWFIVLLLLANVVMFFWVQQQSRPVPGSVALAPPDIGRLQLKREQALAAASKAPDPLPQALIEPAIPVQSEPAPSQAPVETPVVSPGQRPSGPEPGLVSAESPVAAVTQGIPEATEPEVPAAAFELQATTLRPTQAAEPESVEPPSDAAVELVESAGPDDASSAGSPGQMQPEVSSQAQDVAESDGAGQQLGEVVVLQSESSVACVRIGPFAAKDADRLLRRLPSYVRLLSDISEEYDLVDGYYAMIPPFAEREEGRAMVRKLHEAGFKDTWLFSKGELRNAISLGVFRREPSARRHVENIVKKGFNAEVVEKTKPRERRWLHLEHSDKDLRSSLALPENIRIEPLVCP